MNIPGYIENNPHFFFVCFFILQHLVHLPLHLATTTSISCNIILVIFCIYVSVVSCMLFIKQFSPPPPPLLHPPCSVIGCYHVNKSQLHQGKKWLIQIRCQFPSKSAGFRFHVFFFFKFLDFFFTFLSLSLIISGLFSFILSTVAVLFLSLPLRQSRTSDCLWTDVNRLQAQTSGR